MLVIFRADYESKACSGNGIKAAFYSLLFLVAQRKGMVIAMDNTNIYERIVSASCDAILLTDKNGVIILANQAAADSFHLSLPQVIGKTPGDMIAAGIYYSSSILEALKTKQVVSRLITLKDHRRLSTSIPLLDENGEISMILTNSRSENVMNEYAKQLAYEKEQHDLYQQIVNYLSGIAGEELIYKSPQMLEIVEECNTIAGVDSPVLVMGESGVGKELIAKMIHSLSRRKDRAFIPVNCSAIPSELFESEFFGYKPGAFTGASTRGKMGLIQMANKGTLFLDELEELPLLMQSKLLRFVETGEIYPVGSSTPIRLDARIISATNRDLFRMVQEKSFREDLYYRLNVIPIHIPPLRARPEDIDVLAVSFLNRYNKKFDKTYSFSNSDLNALRSYSWPGNVRELRNSIERMVLLSMSHSSKRDMKEILLMDRKEEQFETADNPASSVFRFNLSLPLKAAMEQFQKEYINAVLKKHGGNIQATADALDVNRTTLYRKQQRVK